MELPGPIPNPEVKRSCADGTRHTLGRVGSCHDNCTDHVSENVFPTGSSVGRAAVSKSAGPGFESLPVGKTFLLRFLPPHVGGLFLDFN